ncbi:MAG TPA: BTAD domain-containing putative transcriptional regulator, partial [Usitatibacter sp.]|nr:BTAD domain-containing putative transcriptional regulator [Usitatibacter sp.]
MNCHPWWIPEVMSQLCAHALEANIEVEYVRRLILKRGLVPPGGQAEQDAWPYRLRIYTLGRFSVVIDGEALRFTAKAQKKPLELLKAVIALGGRGVAIGTLVQELWPDLEGDAAHNALHVALHRLRRLLGDEDMVSVQESSLFVSPRLGWVDAWAFERVAGLTAELPADGDAGRVRCLAARVQQLYSGHFLADESMPCAVLRRERLRSKFVRASSRLGSLLEARNDFADARDIYQRALEMDPLAEEFHRGVMRCLKAQGRVPEALEAYRRCRQLLSVALGVQPSAETQALYRVLAG